MKNNTQNGATKPLLSDLADKWLSAKQQQRTLHKRRDSLVKLIRARHDRLSNLATVIQNEINVFRQRIDAIDAELSGLEAEKDGATEAMLEALQGGEQ